MTLPSTARGTRPPAATVAAAVSLRGARPVVRGADALERPRPRRRGRRVRRGASAPTGPARPSLVQRAARQFALSAGAVTGRRPAAGEGEPSRRLHPAAEGVRPRSSDARARPRPPRPGRPPPGACRSRARARGPGGRGDRRGRRERVRRRARRHGCRAASSSGCGSPRRWSATARAAVRRTAALARPGNQQCVSALIDAAAARGGRPVVFVTHEINPILPLVDRVLYLVDGRRIGRPDEVMTAGGAVGAVRHHQVDVLRVRDRLVVVGADAADAAQLPRGRPMSERQRANQCYSARAKCRPSASEGVR